MARTTSSNFVDGVVKKYSGQKQLRRERAYAVYTLGYIHNERLQACLFALFYSGGMESLTVGWLLSYHLTFTIKTAPPQLCPQDEPK